MEPYVIWLIVAIVFVILEIFTSGFAVLCFGIGAAVAAIVSCYAGFNAQLIAMVVGTALSFVSVRPFVLKIISRKKQEVKTNADALVGRRGIVSETVDASQHTGRVAIDGDDWKAVSVDGSRIEVGQSVVIVNRESLIITVKK